MDSCSIVNCHRGLGGSSDASFTPQLMMVAPSNQAAADGSSKHGRSELEKAKFLAKTVILRFSLVDFCAEALQRIWFDKALLTTFCKLWIEADFGL